MRCLSYNYAIFGTMNRKDQERLIKVFGALFVGKHILASPFAKLDPDYSFGHNIILTSSITGIVAFGSSYPFSGMDLRPEYLMEFVELFERRDPAGVLCVTAEDARAANQGRCDYIEPGHVLQYVDRTGFIRHLTP